EIRRGTSVRREARRRRGKTRADLMRIGIMLRSVADRGGVGIYTRNIVEQLLRIDPRNEYVLLYKSPNDVGRFAGVQNVRERLLESRSKVVWDQILVPRAAKQERLDLIFHPKFTLPLLVSAKTVMVVHGADWFLPQYQGLYHPVDVRYMKLMMPFY